MHFCTFLPCPKSGWKEVDYSSQKSIDFSGALRLHAVYPSEFLRGPSVPFLLTTSKVSGCWLRNRPPPPPPPLCQRGRGFLPSTKRHHVSHFYPLSLSLRRLINRTLSRGDNRAEYTISHLPTFYTVPPEWPLRG